ncbi:hypothetical protein Scep_025740 [Stephania cephalantha]|uniref:Uncharacterized protein n=1 Tax=Stephania cephalantha TaxID=152367 RepID=A0AAP0EIT8_9MAGN
MWSIGDDAGQASDNVETHRGPRKHACNFGTVATQWAKQHSAGAVEVCELCGDYSHSAHNCPYYPQYENYHYSSYASPQPDIFGLMSNPQIPRHEGNQQFHQSTSLEDMMKQLIDNQQQFQRLLEELRQIDFEIPGLKDLETQFIQYNDRLQNMIDEEELCSAQLTFNPEEDVSVDIQARKAADTERGRPTSGVGATTHPPMHICHTLQGVKVRERSHIFYTADTFVLDDPDATNSFVFGVPNELLNLKEGVHASLPKYVDTPFVFDISKGEGIT